MTVKRTRNKVGLSQESAIDLMQEIYTEIIDERNRALQTFKKFSQNTGENTDIAMVGKITNELLKIVDSSIEKKIRLLKIQTDILYKIGKPDDGENNSIITEDLATSIHKQMKDALKVQNEIEESSTDNTTLNYQ